MAFILVYMLLTLPKPATYAHNGKEWSSSPIDNSINKLTNYHSTIAKVDWSAFLRLASETYQMSISA